MQKGLSQDAEECSFIALKDNVRFYEKGGADNLMKLSNFHVFRFERPAMESICKKSLM